MPRRFASENLAPVAERNEAKRTRDPQGEIAMSVVIGTFIPTKGGGWDGSILTLTMRAKVRLVPNDNRDNDRAPAFRVFIGKSRIGDAWTAITNNENSRNYLRVTFDGPDLREPFSAALFPSDGREAQLVWRRQE